MDGAGEESERVANLSVDRSPFTNLQYCQSTFRCTAVVIGQLISFRMRRPTTLTFLANKVQTKYKMRNTLYMYE